jgi:hypothetical protein
MSTELKKALYNISALVDLGEAITSVNDFQEKIQSALYVITGTFLANKGAILSYDKSSNSLKTLIQKGFAPADLARVNHEELKQDARRQSRSHALDIRIVRDASVAVNSAVD